MNRPATKAEVKELEKRVNLLENVVEALGVQVLTLTKKIAAKTRKRKKAS